MVVGHPDYQTWSGRSMGAGEVVVLAFAGTVSSEATGEVIFSTVPDGEEWFYQNIIISGNNDTAIQSAIFFRNSETKIIYTKSFILSDNADFPGQKIEAGDYAKLRITNHAAVTVEFIGSVSWLKRKL